MRKFDQDVCEVCGKEITDYAAQVPEELQSEIYRPGEDD